MITLGKERKVNPQLYPKHVSQELRDTALLLNKDTQDGVELRGSK